MKILHLDASPRGERSHTRALSGEVVEALRAAEPDASVVYRDLGRQPVPLVSEDWVLGAFAPPEVQTENSRAAIAVSDELVDELLEADVLVAGVPMYNFAVPAHFKAWIDQIVRVGRTFSYPDFQGLASGKRAIFVLGMGSPGYGDGGAMHALDAETPYIKQVMGFIGITDLTFIALEGTNSDEVRAQSLARARRQIAELSELTAVAA